MRYTVVFYAFTVNMSSIYIGEISFLDTFKLFKGTFDRVVTFRITLSCHW